MDTTKIAALYTPLVAQLLSYPTAANNKELRALLLLRREDTALTADYEVRVRDFAPEGTNLDQRCPLRVHAWASAQMPTTDQRQSDADSWSAMLADFTAPKGEFVLRYSIGSDFATLLRGVRHYQRKLDRGTKKLLAQLRAYHAQQLAAEAEQAVVMALAEESATASALTQLAAGREVSCLHLPLAEHSRRVGLAEELEAQEQKLAGRPNGRYGREIMWHPAFAAELVATIALMPLPQVATYLGYGLAMDFNQDNDLDLADYAYLADCLREGLANNPTPLAALRLTRALTWVEQAGVALLATAQPYLTASQGEAAPALAA